jgi:hypothetical protein
MLRAIPEFPPEVYRVVQNGQGSAWDALLVLLILSSQK